MLRIIIKNIAGFYFWLLAQSSKTSWNFLSDNNVLYQYKSPFDHTRVYANEMIFDGTLNSLRYERKTKHVITMRGLELSTPPLISGKGRELEVEFNHSHYFLIVLTYSRLTLVCVFICVQHCVYILLNSLGLRLSFIYIYSFSLRLSQ